MLDEKLLRSCLSGNLEELKDSISKYEATDEVLMIRDNAGKSLASLAACFGQLTILEELIKVGADINEKSVRGYSALHWASSWGHLDVVKYLVNGGAILDTQTIHMETPRMLAERYEKGDCAEYLHKAEKFQELKQLAFYYKDIINDAEKNLGRFNKEDKLYGNRYCDDKIDWVETNRDIASLTLINSKIEELHSQMKNSMSKLED